jgi:polar amino acid transport system substrate-binding protein
MKVLVWVVAIAAVVGVAAVLVALRHDDATGDASGVFVPMTAGVLTVATDFPAPGFWEGGSVDDVTGGFEADLADELADRFGLARVVVVNRPFEDLVSGEADGFDLALAQISVTSDRRKVVDLSTPYLSTPVGLLGRPDLDVPDLAEARTLRWGVAADTTEVDVVDKLIRPEPDVTTYPDTEALIAAASAHDVDVAAVDLARGLAEADADPQLTVLAQVTAPQFYAALLPRGSGNLEAVNSAIRKLHADGTLRALEETLYEGHEVTMHNLPILRVNP